MAEHGTAIYLEMESMIFKEEIQHITINGCLFDNNLAFQGSAIFFGQKSINFGSYFIIYFIR